MLHVILALFCFFTFPSSLTADSEIPQMPKLYLNGDETSPTIQDLWGILTRPLRVLVSKNNEASGDELIQVYALGAREGDDLRMELAVPVAGMRLTLYKILREPDGTRYLSMPLTVFYDKPGRTSHAEKIMPFRSEFLIIVFEKTGSTEEKNAHVRYFEEKARKLVIESFQTNLMLSSLKLKMKDFGDEQAHEFFQRDAQELIDRFINPQRIFVIRVWKDETKKDTIVFADLQQGDFPLEKIIE